MTAAFSCKYFCEICNVGYSENTRHVCSNRCRACLRNPKCDEGIEKVKCSLCNREFFGTNCAKSHKDKGLCEKLKSCPLCKRVYIQSRIKIHKCDSFYCSTCLCDRPREHLCYVPKYIIPKEDPKQVFVAFDFECSLIETSQNGVLAHIPNLCVTQIVCLKCIHQEINICDICGPREKIFHDLCEAECKGECVIRAVFEYLFSLIQRGLRVVMIGHNIGGYDGHLLIRYIFDHPELFHETPKLTIQGCKIYAITISKLRIIDSLNFFHCALRKLPKMFGLNQLKGFFPYLFNSKNNQNYVGPLPAKEFYLPESMMIEEREEFDQWYNELSENGYLYEHKKELIKYCSSDVSILLQSCCKFYDYFKSSFGINIFQTSLTIAAACNRIYRAKFMDTDTIGIIPLKGYRLRDNHSPKSLDWLYLEELKRNSKIMHSGNGYEKRIGQYIVDGYLREASGREIVFEYLGCYYHSCSRCFPNTPEDRQKAIEFIRRREGLDRKLDYLRNYFELVVIWECEFKTLLRENPSLLISLKNNPYTLTSPLSPRDAFYGGRTSAIKHYHKCSSLERIMYFDVCSLYPYMNKKFKIPIGHPKVLLGEEATDILNRLDTFEGLVKARVLPPQSLFHPVLPYRLHNKLMFFLCYTCASTYNSDECDHSENERSFEGTWVVDELRKAVELGYKILSDSEAWEYEVTEGIFGEFVNFFLTEKVHASGYPPECTSDDDKIQFMLDYFEREGLLLDFDKIEKNNPKRSIAKLILNSFWGKFGENVLGKSSTVIVREPQEFYDLVTSPKLEVSKIIPLSEDSLLITYMVNEEAQSPLNTVSVAIAAYTTCGARLELYKYLERLQERIIYMDTDSVIFTLKDGEYCPPVGCFLGEMTDELEAYGKGSYIEEFVSGGPKNYCFRVITPNKPPSYVVKVKGFTLNSENSKKINFESMKDLVLKSNDENLECEDFIETRNNRIVRKGLGNVFSINEKKIYRMTVGKRRVHDDLTTTPWGYLRRDT